jgi:hypothetical protein
MASECCEACGAPRDGEHPHLCGSCAANIDRWTKEAKENLDLKKFARSDDMIGPVLAAWRDETNRVPPQRPWSA